MSPSDTQLLRAFVEQGDDAAFAELVRRRIDFVYGCALRQLGGDAHKAADLAQEVFIALARKAPALTGHPTLLGWLCTATRFAAVDAVRSEQKRKLREEEASAMQQNDNQGHHDWERLQPVLDAVLTELPAQDREVVLARYFDRQTFAEIGRDFGLSENAAQKRVDRALDRLREALARRDVKSTTAALGIALAGQPGVAAPAGLVGTITQAALGATSAASAGSGGAVLGFLFMQKHAALLLGLAAAIGVGTTVVGVRAERGANAALEVSRGELGKLTARVRALEQGSLASAERLRLATATHGALREETERLRVANAAPAAPATAEPEPFTADLVRQRLRLAQALVENGDPALALRELIWCYDVGMPRTMMGPARTTLLLSFGRLGERYPAAVEELRRRREIVQVAMRGDEGSYEAVQEYAMINRALKADAETVALLETLPEGDRRRRTLASASYDYLIEKRRYREAAEGRTYASISSLFEMNTRRTLPPTTPNFEATQRQVREGILTRGAVEVEMLAGSGDLSHAREHAARILAFDGSESTRALIQKHLGRAGQPSLLSQPAAP